MSAADEQDLPSWQQLLDLVVAAVASGYAELRLEMPGVRLVLSREITAHNVDLRQSAAEPPADVSVNLAADTVHGGPQAHTVADEHSDPQDRDLYAIRAPILGVAYLRPAPDAEPFVAVGDVVQVEDTVAIIEVMKMMTPVEAGVAGTVERICVTSGEMLEHGDVIALVRRTGER